MFLNRTNIPSETTIKFSHKYSKGDMFIFMCILILFIFLNIPQVMVFIELANDIVYALLFHAIKLECQNTKLVDFYFLFCEICCKWVWPIDEHFQIMCLDVTKNP